MITYPNQKVVTVSKPKYEKNFITVSIDEFKEAFIILTKIELAIFIYLCGNKDGYTFALSPEHIMTEYKISKSSYHRAIERLIELRYLVANGGNHYIFCSTRPTGEYKENNVSTSEYKKTVKPTSEYNESQKRVEPVPPVSIGSPTSEYMVYSQMNTEIDNINNINKIDMIDRGDAIHQPEEGKREEPKKDLSFEVDEVLAKIAEEDKRYVEAAIATIPNGAKSVAQLRNEKNRSWEWICAALERKEAKLWEEKGLGVCFTHAFAAEVDSILAARNAKYKNIGKGSGDAAFEDVVIGGINEKVEGKEYFHFERPKEEPQKTVKSKEVMLKELESRLAAILDD